MVSPSQFKFESSLFQYPGESDNNQSKTHRQAESEQPIVQCRRKLPTGYRVERIDEIRQHITGERRCASRGYPG